LLNLLSSGSGFRIRTHNPGLFTVTLMKKIWIVVKILTHALVESLYYLAFTHCCQWATNSLSFTLLIIFFKMLAIVWTPNITLDYFMYIRLIGSYCRLSLVLPFIGRVWSWNSQTIDLRSCYSQQRLYNGFTHWYRFVKSILFPFGEKFGCFNSNNSLVDC
jgi:hypothetical protein